MSRHSEVGVDETGEHSSRKDSWGWSDRRHPSATQIIAICMLAFQLGAFVWGAATIKASVDNLRETVVDMKTETINNRNAISDVKADVQVLKERIK